MAVCEKCISYTSNASLEVLYKSASLGNEIVEFPRYISYGCLSQILDWARLECESLNSNVSQTMKIPKNLTAVVHSLLQHIDKASKTSSKEWLLKTELPAYFDLKRSLSSVLTKNRSVCCSIAHFLYVNCPNPTFAHKSATERKRLKRLQPEYRLREQILDTVARRSRREMAKSTRFTCATSTENNESPHCSTAGSNTGVLKVVCQSETSSDILAVAEVTLSCLNKTLSIPASNEDMPICDHSGVDTTLRVASKSKLTAEDLEMVCDNENDDTSSNVSTSSSVLPPAFNSPSMEGNHQRSRGGRAHGTQLNHSASIIKQEWLKPFELGWKRELVFRNAQSDQEIRSPLNNRKCDIYYYTPTSAKLRSTPEILSYLEKTGSNLSAENFSFSKFPIYKEPFETSRCAGKISLGKKVDKEIHEGGSSSSPKRSLSNGSLNNKRRSSVIQVPVQLKRLKLSVEGSTGCKIIDDNNVSEQSPRTCESLNAVLPRKELHANKLLSVAPQPTTDSFNVIPASSCLSSVNSTQKLCSLRCPGLFGVAPKISCGICRCLFHSFCIGQDLRRAPFVCQNCRKAGAIKNLEFRRVQQQKLPKPLRLRLLSHPRKPNHNVMQVMPRLSVCPQLTSTDMNLYRNGPPSLQSYRFPVKNINPNDGPIRRPPPLIAAPHGVVLSAVPFRNAFPRTTVSYRPLQTILTASRTPCSRAVIPPLVSVCSNPIPVTVIDVKPDLQTHPVVIDIRSTPPNIYPTASTAVTKVLPSTRVTSNGVLPNMPNISSQSMSIELYSNTSTPVVCNRTPLQPSSIRVTLPSIVPVDTCPSTNVQVSQQVAYNNSQSVTSTSISPSLRVPSAVISGQLLPLPMEISSQLDLSRPVSIKIGSHRILLGADSILKTPSGVSIAVRPHLLEQLTNSTSSTTSVQKGSLEGLPKNNHTATGFSGEITKTITDLDDLPSVDSSLVDLVSISSSISESSICSLPNQKQLLIIERHTPFRKFNTGVESIQRIFSCLRVIDLLQVSRVCRVWRNLAAQQHLWQTVRLHGLRVTNWNKAAVHFSKVVTRHLDLRGIIMTGTNIEIAWQNLTDIFTELITVRQLEFGPCPASVVEKAVSLFWRLEHLSAECIVSTVTKSPAVLNIATFPRLTYLDQLKLRGAHGLSVEREDDLECLGQLEKLKTLSLTTLRKVPGRRFEFIGLLHQLNVLELGECYDWESTTFEQLGKLVNLRTLRLEFGGEITGNGLSEALQKFKKLQQLELIRYIVSESVLNLLPMLSQLRFLSLWPDQSPTEFQRGLKTHSVMSAVGQMTFLCRFEWGIIKSPTNDADTIPILDELKSSELSLCTINDLVSTLSTRLPSTKIRVFRVPAINQHCV